MKRIRDVFVFGVLFFCGFIQANEQTQSMDDVRGFQPKDYEDLRQYYLKNGATKYDNFHHEYLMMMWHGFPNLQIEARGEMRSEVSVEEILNPQNIVHIEDYLANLHGSPSPLDTKRLIESDLNLRTAEKTLKSLDEMEAHSVLDESEYMREGYYKYFRSYLQRNSTDKKVEVCIRLDVDSLTEGSLKEKYLKLTREVYAGYFDLDNEELVEFMSYHECNGLFIGLAQLDHLNESKAIELLYPPVLKKLDRRLQGFKFD